MTSSHFREVSEVKPCITRTPSTLTILRILHIFWCSLHWPSAIFVTFNMHTVSWKLTNFSQKKDWRHFWHKQTRNNSLYTNFNIYIFIYIYIIYTHIRICIYNIYTFVYVYIYYIYYTYRLYMYAVWPFSSVHYAVTNWGIAYRIIFKS